MRAGARSVGRDVADRVKTTLNGGRRTTGDVWETATTEPPPDEAPECAWCPICRAARRYRESATGGAPSTGGQAAGTPPTGLGSQLAGVSETLAGLAQDAFSIFDSALRSAQRPPARSAEPSRPPWASATSEGGTGWPGAPTEASDPVPPEPIVSVTDDAPGADTPVTNSAGPDSPLPGSAASGAAGSDDGPVVGSAVLGGAAVHPQDQDGESAHEGGDREERGEAGNAPVEDVREDQVERPTE